MKPSRRFFLTALGTAMVSNGVLLCPKVEAATLLFRPQGNRYAEVVAQYRGIVDQRDLMRMQQVRSFDCDHPSNVQLHLSINTLFRTLLDRFPENPHVDDCRALFERFWQPLAIDETQLRLVLPGMMVIYVVKTLIQQDRVLFDTSRVPAFDDVRDHIRLVVMHSTICRSTEYDRWSEAARQIERQTGVRPPYVRTWA